MTHEEVLAFLLMASKEANDKVRRKGKADNAVRFKSGAMGPEANVAHGVVPSIYRNPPEGLKGAQLRDYRTAMQDATERAYNNTPAGLLESGRPSGISAAREQNLSIADRFKTAVKPNNAGAKLTSGGIVPPHPTQAESLTSRIFQMRDRLREMIRTGTPITTIRPDTINAQTAFYGAKPAGGSPWGPKLTRFLNEQKATRSGAASSGGGGALSKYVGSSLAPIEPVIRNIGSGNYNPSFWSKFKSGIGAMSKTRGGKAAMIGAGVAGVGAGGYAAYKYGKSNTPVTEKAQNFFATPAGRNTAIGAGAGAVALLALASLLRK